MCFVCEGLEGMMYQRKWTGGVEVVFKVVPLRPIESQAALYVRTKDASSVVGRLKRSPEPIYSPRSGSHYTLAAECLYGGYEALVQITQSVAVRC